MFDPEFFPTPEEVYQMMDINPNGKVVLEPHAGSGNLVNFLLRDGASKVLVCEKNEKLQRIVKGMDCQFLKDDFFELTSSDISHIDMIVMNPPFSNAKKHIIHAFNIAPDGCQIYSLCNSSTVNKVGNYSELGSLIYNYGSTVSLGNCFSLAERKTDVEVSMVHLRKPGGGYEKEFDGFFMDEEPEGSNTSGMMQHDQVRAIVNNYIYAVKSYDEMMKYANQVNTASKYIGGSTISMELGYRDSITNRADLLKILQKQSWKYVFKELKMEKYMASSVMDKVNSFVEKQSEVPFTMKNIYRMLDIIMATRNENLAKSLEETIDEFTKYTPENRWGVEGWKTNSGHMLNKKFIVDYAVRLSISGKLELDGYSTYSRYNKVKDLAKILCVLTGKNYDEIEDASRWDLTPGVWYTWGFFRFKVFKKRTMHIEFLDEAVWYKLNSSYAKLKGFVLPEK